ncbi:bifunctional RNase H/acid phosphatase [Nocardioides pantholopis]|uniref:bifunctional RNase H/acid phosphatase n=1 Tax=Nocardioides pantholopis TaxID=2483798 RepID=UPI000F08BC8F|nr:bifunctional RNase H/acid phosphatase [Nocardioides pantholopis]
MTSGPSRVVVEADGGSRGNPGPAAYGAVLRDADTGEVIAEDGATIGVASNNVAEYSGLVAGLRLAAEHAPEAEIEVRMDSKLVVEQMSGRWKIKHPDMAALAAQANALAPFGTTYTWVPRERNGYADRLVNQALDGKRSGVTVLADTTDEDSLIEEIESPAAAVEGEPPAAAQSRARGWSASSSEPTTLVLVRHGVTAHTIEKRFSGGLASANPGLSDEGRDQVRATAQWIAPIAEQVDAVVASPVRRTQESAEIVAEVLGAKLLLEPGFAEMEFGHWDGLTFGEVAERHPEELDAWLGSLDAAPPGGESFRVVEERVLGGLQRVLDEHAGRTVVVVSHVTPIKTLVAHAVDAPLDAVFRMELSPASVTVVSFFSGGVDGTEPRTSMRLYNALPPGNDAFANPGAW